MRIAIIGFGFSGLMAAANLVQAAKTPLELYVIAPNHTPLGVAYGTTQVRHLLNVRAANMGAWADDIGDFVRWLQSDEGKYQSIARGLKKPPGEQDFAPRALYGDYLQSIWRSTQALASEKKIHVRLVPATATRIAAGDPLSVMTDRGDAIAVDTIILATGNEVKPILTQLHHDVMLQNPWKLEASTVAKLLGPVALIGMGLTAVDTILSLRAHGYAGEIITVSRNGLFPRPHKDGLASATLDKDELLSQRTPGALLQCVRSKVAQHNGDWREVIDGLRPHTQAIWQKLAAKDQKRFFVRLFTLWNVHRHRMAPEIAATIEKEIAGGMLHVLRLRSMNATMEGNQPVFTVTMRDGVQETLKPSLVINCTGTELNPMKSAHSLLPQLLRDGLAEAHGTGAGFAADRNYALWGTAYPNLYAIGTPMTGQFLESTAVPELRVQAQVIAKHIVKN